MINSATPNGADSSYHFGTTAFTATTALKCVVTTDAQVSTSSSTPGTKGPFFRNAIRRNGVDANDLAYGLYFYSNAAGFMSSQSRTTIFNVAAGESVQFGFYLGSTPESFQNHLVDGITTYSCS